MGQNSQNGVHHSTAWAIAKAEGIELARKGHTHITAEQHEAIVETLKETHNAAQAAKKNGGNQVTALAIAKAEGIELKKRLPQRTGAKAQAANLV